MNNHDILIKKLFIVDNKIGNKFTKFRYHKDKYINIYNYITNRFNDNKDSKSILKENLHRIRLGIENRPVCKTCGKYTSFNINSPILYLPYCSVSCSLKDPVIHKKQEATKLKKYGSVNNYNKCKETCIKKYGVDNVAKNNDIKQKQKNTNIKKYGYSSPLLNKDIKEKTKNTNIAVYRDEISQRSDIVKRKIASGIKTVFIEKYGVDNPMKIKMFVDKQKQTVYDRYGVNNITKSKLYQNKINEINIKRNQTKEKNKTFNSSNAEKLSIELLKQKYNIVFEHYISDRYPYECDAYIKDLDLYIEFNYHWTHGNEPYIGTDDQNEIINKWKSKNTKYYNNAITTWTIRDVNKLNTAKKNKLNYLVFYTYIDFLTYIKNI